MVIIRGRRNHCNDSEHSDINNGTTSNPTGHSTFTYNHLRWEIFSFLSWPSYKGKRRKIKGSYNRVVYGIRLDYGNNHFGTLFLPSYVSVFCQQRNHWRSHRYGREIQDKSLIKMCFYLDIVYLQWFEPRECNRPFTLKIDYLLFFFCVTK